MRTLPCPALALFLLPSLAQAQSLIAQPGCFQSAAGGTQNLALDFGPQNAGQYYLLLGSGSGTQPGIPFQGVTLPLVPDGYFQYLLSAPPAPFFPGQVGFLDGQGRATAQLDLPPLSVAAAGLHLDHAAVTLDLFAPGVSLTAATPAAPLIVCDSGASFFESFEDDAVGAPPLGWQWYTPWGTSSQFGVSSALAFDGNKSLSGINQTNSAKGLWRPGTASQQDHYLEYSFRVADGQSAGTITLYTIFLGLSLEVQVRNGDRLTLAVEHDFVSSSDLSFDDWHRLQCWIDADTDLVRVAVDGELLGTTSAQLDFGGGWLSDLSVISGNQEQLQFFLDDVRLCGLDDAIDLSDELLVNESFELDPEGVQPSGWLSNAAWSWQHKMFTSNSQASDGLQALRFENIPNWAQGLFSPDSNVLGDQRLSFDFFVDASAPPGNAVSYVMLRGNIFEIDRTTTGVALRLQSEAGQPILIDGLAEDAWHRCAVYVDAQQGELYLYMDGLGFGPFADAGQLGSGWANDLSLYSNNTSASSGYFDRVRLESIQVDLSVLP